MTSGSFEWRPDLPALTHEEYLADFWPYFEAMTSKMRKIEVGQSFSEPGNPSWEAFSTGDWNRSLQCIDEHAPETRQYFEGLRDAGKQAARVRVVELPLTEYLVWEFNVLVRSATFGEQIRVIERAKARNLTDEIPIDDFVAIDDVVAYRVLYDAEGLNVGAERTTDRGQVRAIVAAFEVLFARGEPIDSFFERRVEPRTPKY